MFLLSPQNSSWWWERGPMARVVGPIVWRWLVWPSPDLCPLGHNWSLVAYGDTVQSFPAGVHTHRAAGSCRLCCSLWSFPRPSCYSCHWPSCQAKAASPAGMQPLPSSPEEERLPVPGSTFLSWLALLPKFPPYKGRNMFSPSISTCFVSPQLILTS